MPIVVENNRANADLFTSVTGTDSQVVGSLEELKRFLADSPNEYAIVLGPAVDLEASAALADTLRVTRPSVSVILIRRRVDTSVLAEALRSGMREVVDERDLTGLGVRRVAGSAGLAGAERRRGRPPTAPAAGRSPSSPPRVGSARPRIAVNLALALSENGAKRVALVDLDLAFGDVAITLQLFPARTIADTVHLESGLDFTVLEPLLTDYRGELSALVAPVQPDAKDSIPPSLVGRILSLLKSNFDYVVVDTSPSFDEYALQAFDETDEMLLVTTLDVPTLKNVKVAVETLDLLNFPKPRRRLILNRADDKVGLTPDKVESTLGDVHLRGHPHVVPGRPRDQLRRADHQRPAAAPREPGHRQAGPQHRRDRSHRSGAGGRGEEARAAAPKRSLLRRNGR